MTDAIDTVTDAIDTVTDVTDTVTDVTDTVTDIAATATVRAHRIGVAFVLRGGSTDMDTETTASTGWST